MLPASGPLPSLTADPGGWLARMAMPAIALGVPVAGQLTRVIRTSMVEELDKDYVRTALCRHPEARRGGPQNVAQRADHARDGARPGIGYLMAAPWSSRSSQPPGMGTAILGHPVQLHDARAGRRAAWPSPSSSSTSSWICSIS
ncbi:MAG: hypothetical protein ACLT98_16315 [Eggerthellaceae bacterium]